MDDFPGKTNRFACRETECDRDTSRRLGACATIVDAAGLAVNRHPSGYKRLQGKTGSQVAAGCRCERRQPAG